jgi:hypothetical protein
MCVGVDNNYRHMTVAIIDLVLVYAIRRVSATVYRREVLDELRKSGENICTRCGYDLHGLGIEVIQCPECGTFINKMSTMGP